jgi:hypothetical protein
MKIASIGLHNNNNKMQNQPVNLLHIGYKMLGNASLQSALSTLGTVFLYIHSNQNTLIVSHGELGRKKIASPSWGGGGSPFITLDSV